MGAQLYKAGSREAKAAKAALSAPGGTAGLKAQTQVGRHVQLAAAQLRAACRCALVCPHQQRRRLLISSMSSLAQQPPHPLSRPTTSPTAPLLPAGTPRRPAVDGWRTRQARQPQGCSLRFCHCHSCHPVGGRDGCPPSRGGHPGPPAASPRLPDQADAGRCEWLCSAFMGLVAGRAGACRLARAQQVKPCDAWGPRTICYSCYSRFPCLPCRSPPS